MTDRKTAALILLAVPLIAPSLWAQAPLHAGQIDPVFAKIPFEQWFSAEQARVKWSTDIPEPILSAHQRLLTSIHVKLDGQDLAQRRGQGEMALLIQLRDSAGSLWQTHNAIDLRKLQEAIKGNDIEYVQSFFILPGEYEASIAIFDTATGEHATARKKVKVAALKGDPLPDAWGPMPAVEFIELPQGPDTWFLPRVTNRLSLTARPQRPVSLDVVVNVTPTERLSGTTQARDRTLGLLLPAMKLFAQTDWGNASLRVSFLDLARRTVSFDQQHVHDLDWTRAKEAFSDAAPGLIDVKTLENRKYTAKFFTDELRRHIEGEAPPTPTARQTRVVIVLSSPIAFTGGVERHPIELEPGGDYRLYYVRYHPYTPVLVMNNPLQQMARGRNPFGGDEISIRPAPGGSQEDQLVPLLKGVHPTLFDVSNAEQFRKALATIVSEIARL